MEIEYSPTAMEDIAIWKKTGNTQALEKITTLIANILETPFSGIGKPEPLKHQLSGAWSRRITQEHRIVYEVTGNTIRILSLRGHYA